MNNRKGFKYLPGFVLAASVAALAVSSGGCSAASSAAGALSGCDEFNGGASAIASLSIDANTKAFVQASADLVGVANAMETAVLNACIKIDTDLGVPDTWTAKKPADSSTNPDDELTEACTQASNKINAILAAGTTANVSCTLAVAGGQCTVDANAQVNCEGSCTGSASCMANVTADCEPGQLSVQCSGTCNASATCEGSATVDAQCQGSCEADCAGECDAVPGTAPKVECQGTCSGNCTGTCDGSSTSGAKCAGTCKGQCDQNCTYTAGTPPKVHCAGKCTGKCNGNCKLDASANISCGANVSCKGGCTGTATAPKCEGELKASCMGDANCQASCQSHAEATAMCTPPTVTLECDGTVTSDITKLIATLQANLPAIVEAVQTQGVLALKAVGHVGDTGKVVVSGLGSVGGKALACATAAVQASVNASVSVNVSVKASASCSGSAGGPTQGS